MKGVHRGFDRVDVGTGGGSRILLARIRVCMSPSLPPYYILYSFIKPAFRWLELRHIQVCDPSIIVNFDMHSPTWCPALLLLFKVGTLNSMTWGCIWPLTGSGCVHTGIDSFCFILRGSPIQTWYLRFPPPILSTGYPWHQ